MTQPAAASIAALDAHKVRPEVRVDVPDVGPCRRGWEVITVAEALERLGLQDVSVGFYEDLRIVWQGAPKRQEGAWAGLDRLVYSFARVGVSACRFNGYNVATAHRHDVAIAADRKTGRLRVVLTA